MLVVFSGLPLGLSPPGVNKAPALLDLGSSR